MTVASEISRLQCAKADICTAIENKGVTVWNITLDWYACCIDEIQQGWGWQYVDVLVIWAWWPWGRQGSGLVAWWGWAGWVIYQEKHALGTPVSQVIVWNYQEFCNWNDSLFDGMLAHWGGKWGWGVCVAKANNWTWNPWGSWGGVWACCNNYMYMYSWPWLPFQWNAWGRTLCLGTCCACYNTWGGGWGAGWTWTSSIWCCMWFWDGWPWIVLDIEGTQKCYAWGWGWGGYCCGGSASHWGWAGWRNGVSWGNWTTPWSWWGWGSPNNNWWLGANWIVVVRYPTDWSYWITDATGWCKYTCWDYTIHCFTQNDNFIVWTPSWCYISYLVVWGWGGGYYSWWGGWDVCYWTMEACDSYCVTVGAGWTSWWDWTASCLWDIVANWGCWPTQDTATTGIWWTSWSGKIWSCRTYSCFYWGWGWAASDWVQGYSNLASWMWGLGALGYWWGGEWGMWNGFYSRTICWGWYGTRTSPTGCGENCWGWGWGSGWGWKSNWACWVVDICYACDGSYWFCTATGWDCCYLCGNMCVHRFTSDWTFTITW